MTANADNSNCLGVQGQQDPAVLNEEDPAFYEAWNDEQTKANQRGKHETEMIEEKIIPLFEADIGDCQICAGEMLALRVLPCNSEHSFCDQCLLKSWSSVGKLL